MRAGATLRQKAREAKTQSRSSLLSHGAEERGLHLARVILARSGRNTFVSSRGSRSYRRAGVLQINTERRCRAQWVGFGIATAVQQRPAEPASQQCDATTPQDHLTEARPTRLCRCFESRRAPMTRPCGGEDGICIGRSGSVRLGPGPWTFLNAKLDRVEARCRTCSCSLRPLSFKTKTMATGKSGSSRRARATQLWRRGIWTSTRPRRPVHTVPRYAYVHMHPAMSGTHALASTRQAGTGPFGRSPAYERGPTKQPCVIARCFCSMVFDVCSGRPRTYTCTRRCTKASFEVHSSGLAAVLKLRDTARYFGAAMQLALQSDPELSSSARHSWHPAGITKARSMAGGSLRAMRKPTIDGALSNRQLARTTCGSSALANYAYGGRSGQTSLLLQQPIMR